MLRFRRKNGDLLRPWGSWPLQGLVDFFGDGGELVKPRLVSAGRLLTIWLELAWVGGWLVVVFFVSLVCQFFLFSPTREPLNECGTGGTRSLFWKIGFESMSWESPWRRQWFSPIRWRIHRWLWKTSHSPWLEQFVDFRSQRARNLNRPFVLKADRFFGFYGVWLSDATSIDCGFP